MSKYQLTDLLNEITGTGRIGTYIDTYRGLVNKIDDLKEKGIRVKELGMSGDGKTPFEFEVYPGDKDEAFSVYPYKFDPSEGDDMEIHRFSIGGKPVAIRAAKELLGDGAMSNAEVKDGLKYLDDAGDDTSSFSDLREQDDAEGFVDELQEEEGFTEVNVDEIKFHLDAYENGTIDGDDLHKAISEILFGEIKAPGMREDTAMSGAVADELEAGAIGDRVAEVEIGDIDLAAITKNKYNNAITTVKDFSDAILDIWNELSDKENEALFQNMALKNAKKFLTRASSQDSDGSEITEEKDTSVEDLLGKIRKHLENKFEDRYRKSEYDLYIDSLERDIKRGEFDGVESIPMSDHEEDFVTYIDEKSLAEHFQRFMFKKYQ
jgi:hypothetical protein